LPFFKTTKNILSTPWEDELWNDNWMDSDKLLLPPKIEWDYSRELKIEDVDIWEVIYQQGGGTGVYAAWSPYAEFYMITLPNLNVFPDRIETYYGPDASEKVIKRCKELKIPVSVNKHWVDPEDLWKYTKKFSTEYYI
jgi:hypothetical protein